MTANCDLAFYLPYHAIQFNLKKKKEKKREIRKKVSEWAKEYMSWRNIFIQIQSIFSLRLYMFTQYCKMNISHVEWIYYKCV